jgi:phage shock protein PspC (stress-responsive transcriptional regulator)
MCASRNAAIVVVMTETTYGPPLPPPPPPPPRLERDPDDSVIAGVCAAFARSTDTDPVLWRVTLAVLALFGGAGLVLYVLGWALIPRIDRGSSFVERTLRGRDDGISAAGVVLVVVAGVVLLGLLSDGPGLGALLVVGAVAYLVARERREPRPVSSDTGYDAQPVPAHGPVPPPLDDPAYRTWAQGPPPRRERRPRSPLGAMTVSGATLVTGVLLALRLSGVESLTAPRILAVALLVVGGGLLVGAWVGRARWLIVVGLALALALGVSVAARDAGLDDGLGERTWTPTGDASYALGAGEAVLDLSSLPATGTAEVDVELGVGRLLVLVPRDVRVTGAAQAGVGELLQVFGDGRRRVLNPDDDTDVRERFSFPGEAGGPTVELDLEVGMGQIEVRRGAA